MLGFLCLVIFFDFNALGGPGFRPPPTRVLEFPHPEPSKIPFFFHQFLDAFLDRFLIDLGSVFPPNLPPKTYQNR